MAWTDRNGEMPPKPYETGLLSTLEKQVKGDISCCGIDYY